MKRKPFCQDQKVGRVRIRARQKAKPMWVPLERIVRVSESQKIS